MQDPVQNVRQARGRKLRRLMLSAIPVSLGMWVAIVGLLLKVVT